MTPTETLTPWLGPVQRYLQVCRDRFGDERPAGATTAEIAALREKMIARSLHTDEQFFEFLSFVNGTAFDGMAFPGTLISRPNEDSRPDFLSYNDVAFRLHPRRYNSLWERRRSDVPLRCKSQLIPRDRRIT